MEKKIVRSRKNDLTKISNSLNPVELLEFWKKSCISEQLARKNAFTSLESFKKWWNLYSKAEELDEKVAALTGEIKKRKDRTDQENDILDEHRNISNELNERFDGQASVWKFLLDNKKKLNEYLKDESLKKYKTYINFEFLKRDGHILDKKDEPIWKHDNGIRIIQNIYDAVASKDLYYEPFTDGKSRRMPDKCTWNQAFGCKDEAIRRNAYMSFYSVLRRNRNTLFTLCNELSYKLYQKAKLLNYNRWFDLKTNELYHLDSADVEQMCWQAEKFGKYIKKASQHNNELIAKAYGIDELSPWDEKMVINDINDSITIEQAKERIIEGLSPLGQEYIDNVKKCFDKNIVYWNAQDKTANGYCMSGWRGIDEHPIEFDWQGDSASTLILAHELGHNIAAKMIRENNEINNIRSHGLKEIPSIVNQLLMIFHYIKKFKEENTNRNYLYGMYWELFSYAKHCLATQPYLLLNFVINSYDSSKGDFNPHKMELNSLNLKRYFYGYTNKEADRELSKYPWAIENLWCYIDFLDYGLDQNFKALPYYIGMVVALPIAWKIFNGDKVTLNKYLKFLKEPTNMNPLAVVKVLGINLLKPEIYTEAKNILAKLVKDFTNDIQIEE